MVDRLTYIILDEESYIGRGAAESNIAYLSPI